ncbi:ABC transporter ATP-binding protein [Streptomyces malaysiensis subsp. malaysiensis]|nr:ABC transporter ATP-binding protein [Streptomyces sp. NA07423]WHX18830.1 ABC transporter ATP-binding protein [Streptomyces sp. NA07423]
MPPYDDQPTVRLRAIAPAPKFPAPNPIPNPAPNAVPEFMEEGDADGAETVGAAPHAGISKNAWHAFRTFWPLTKGDRRWLVLICLCVVIAALAETGAVLLFGELTDHALKEGSVSAFWGPAGKWLAMATFGALIGYIGNSAAVWVAERFVMRLRARIFSHVQVLPPHFFQRHRQGDLVTRLTGDVEAIEQMVVSGVVQTVSALFSTVFFFGAALMLRWDLALATFALAPLFWLAARQFASRIRTAARQERVADGAITSVVEESLGNVVLTQAYNRRRDEEKRLHTEARAWMRASVRGNRLSEMYEQVVQVMETVCVLTIIGLGAWEISEGRMTLGQLLSFAAFLGYLFPPIRQLGQLGLTVTAATAGAERLLEILAARPAVTDPPRAAPPDQEIYGVVEFERVSFQYPGTVTDTDLGTATDTDLGTATDTDLGTATGPATGTAPGGSTEAAGHGPVRPALRDVSFTARPGELVLITGPSGAGKSTVAKLLPRFYDPGAGDIRLDGIPLDALPLEFLRERVTLLPQETLVLHGTIRENIACGRPGATDDEIFRAARDAAAHDFVNALPDGYDTHLAPGTAQLSGGQLQRVAIARALLRDSPVLVLDEPTAGLDALAARQVIAPLRRLMSGRTTLLITHDLHLAPDADRILVLDHGRLAESGRHEELLVRGGTYSRLHGNGAARQLATS